MVLSSTRLSLKAFSEKEDLTIPRKLEFTLPAPSPDLA